MQGIAAVLAAQYAGTALSCSEESSEGVQLVTADGCVLKGSVATSYFLAPQNIKGGNDTVLQAQVGRLLLHPMTLIVTNAKNFFFLLILVLSNHPMI